MKLLSKIGAVLLVLLLCSGCASEPEEETGGSIAVGSVASSANTVVNVESDGSCSVNLHFNVRMKEDIRKLTLPLPADARNVRLNGSLVAPSSSGGQLRLDLSEYAAGSQSLDISYELKDIITGDAEILNVSVPLLTGLNIPIESYSFKVVMPGEVRYTPGFSSGYHGANVGAILNMQVKGTTISGTCAQRLNDHETLTMTYRGDCAMFPDYTPPQPLLGGWDTALVALIFISIVYYLAALMPRVTRKMRTFTPPEGLTAGDVGTCLTGCGVDLTMMVFSWAQMGYLVVQMDRRGRVRLRKLMDMGSERPEWENRCFRQLFDGRQVVEASSYHYARLHRKMAKKSPLLRQIYRSRTGNPQIVRIIGLVAGCVGGVLMSLQVYTASVWTVLLALVMAAACGGLSYMIHFGSSCIPMGNRRSLWISLLCAGVWLVLGLLTNSLLLALGLVAYEWVLGLAAAVGGRRSEMGLQYVAQIRGLRAHLTNGSVFDMQQCQEKNPAYFVDLLPYALALGVENPFARRFGRTTLCECEYVAAPGAMERTPAQWAVLLRQMANCLNRRQQRFHLDRLLYRLKRR